MSKLRNALLFSTIAQQGNLIISFVSITIVARLLTPAEIGVFAVASSLSMLAIEIRSIGVNQYLVREQKLTEDKKRSALGVMMLISWLMAGVIILVSSPIASFYDQPELKFIFWILSGTFLLAPFSTVPFAMLTRDMRFDYVAIVKLSSGITRAAGSIGFVLLGWSYYGLAAGILLGAVVELLAISLIDRGRSLLRPSFTLWREVLSFGLLASSAGVLQRFAQGLPDLVLGRMATMADVGLFSRGMGLVLFLDRLISMAVKPLILPHLSEIRRRGEDVGDAYLKCVVLHGAVSLPAFATAGVLALPLIQLFFGDQWDAAAPIASVVAVWAMLKTIHGFLPTALIAGNFEKLLLGKEITIFITRLLFIIAFATQGLYAAAIGLCLSGVIEVIVCSLISSRVLGLRIGVVARAFLPNAILAAVCWLMAMATSHLISGTALNLLVQLVFISSFTALAWLLTLRLLRHELWTLGHKAVMDGVIALKRRLGSRSI